MCTLFTIFYAICLGIKDFFVWLYGKITGKTKKNAQTRLITQKSQETSQNNTNISHKETISEPITDYQMLTLEELLEDDE